MDDQVEKYIAKQNFLQREILEKIKCLIQKAHPSARECLSYGVPAFRLDKRLVMYAAFKNHIGIYPGPETIEKFSGKLKKYATSKGAIKFKLNESIPYDLIEEIINFNFKKTL